MRSVTAVLGAVMFAAGLASASLVSPRVNAQGFTVVLDCGGGAAAAQVRTTLYLGLLRPKKGVVSELEFQLFLRDEVTRRFPDGLTVWDADGQWRSPEGVIDHERSKVLLLVHPDTAEARRSIQDIIDTYRKTFDQQSVLWESARVCTTF